MSISASITPAQLATLLAKYGGKADASYLSHSDVSNIKVPSKEELKAEPKAAVEIALPIDFAGVMDTENASGKFMTEVQYDAIWDRTTDNIDADANGDISPLQSKYNRTWDENAPISDEEEADMMLIRSGDYIIEDFAEDYIRVLFGKFEKLDCIVQTAADNSDDSDSDDSDDESDADSDDESDADSDDESIAEPVEEFVTQSDVHPLMPDFNEFMTEDQYDAIWDMMTDNIDAANIEKILKGCFAIININQKLKDGETITPEDVVGELPADLQNIVSSMIDPAFVPNFDNNVNNAMFNNTLIREILQIAQDAFDEVDEDDEDDDENDAIVISKPAFDFEVTQDNLDEFASTVETGTIAEQPINLTIGGLKFSVTVRVEGTA